MMDAAAGTRSRVIAAARRWIGTPYRHQGTRRGVGCDCLGLVRGVWHEVYGSSLPDPGPYGADWAAGDAGDPLMNAAREAFGVPFPLASAQPGDLLVFRWRAQLPARHLGILTGQSRFVHAYSGAGALESALVPAWRRRVAAVFAFPVT